MAQKIDIHGLFIDPETITGLHLQKRIAVLFPVFHEERMSMMKRLRSSYEHIVRFDHQQYYGIILADMEQPDPSSFIVNYKEALVDKIFRGISQTGKNIAGHITEALKIEISGDRRYRILQSGRKISQTTIREIPAKVKLLSGQWVDVFKSSPEYDFQGGTPYATTDVDAVALTITVQEKNQEKNIILYGAQVDAPNDEVNMSYHSLAEIYNEIQAKREAEIVSQPKKVSLVHPQRAQINIQLPRIELPRITFQSPFSNGQKQKNTEHLPGSNDET